MTADYKTDTMNVYSEVERQKKTNKGTGNYTNPNDIEFMTMAMCCIWE